MDKQKCYEDDTPRDVSNYLKMSSEERQEMIRKIEEEHQRKKDTAGKSAR